MNKNNLKGFGPVYVINLKKRHDKREYIKNHFEEYSVSDYHFFDAIDGKSDYAKSFLASPSIAISDPEMGCTLSHILVIKYWLETSNSEYAIIAEDDLSLETSQHWPFTWQFFFDNTVKNHDLIQLCVVSPGNIKKELHPRVFANYSTVCYIIKRSRAKEILDNYFSNGKIKLKPSYNSSVAEGVVYSLGECYSIPLFVHQTSLSSDIANDRLAKNTFVIEHRSKNQILDFWKNQ